MIKFLFQNMALDTDDEIDWVTKGADYGWPFVRGHCDENYPNETIFCKSNNVIEDLLSLYPAQTLAVCGFDFYNEDIFPNLKNSLLLLRSRPDCFYN